MMGNAGGLRGSLIVYVFLLELGALELGERERELLTAWIDAWVVCGCVRVSGRARVH